MLRNLIIAGLTTLLFTSVASASPASRGAAKKKDSAHHTAKAPEIDGQHASIAPTATTRRPMAQRATRSRTRPTVKQRIARRVQAAAVNTSLLRPSWTLSDLNPMPQLLDLDDTARDLRRATARIVHMMTR